MHTISLTLSLSPPNSHRCRGYNNYNNVFNICLNIYFVPQYLHSHATEYDDIIILKSCGPQSALPMNNNVRIWLNIQMVL